jgi:ABC-type multidrug transport system ATPase subunit
LNKATPPAAVADPAPALRLRGVAKRYGPRAVLRGATLDLAPGETVAVLGPNGAGKSTLLRIAAGLARPDQGTVESARRPAFLHQDAPLYDELTPAEHVAWWARLHGLPRDDATVDGRLSEAGLARLAHHPAGTLSRGERQRLAVALALLPDPAVAVLDEPFAALDAVAHAWLESLLAARRGRAATLLSVHDEAAARRVADRAVRLAGGRLEAAAP